MRIQKNQDGITLLITLLLMGVLLGVSTSLLNVTLKQFQLSGVAYASEVAFQAANAGMECAQYNDWVNTEFIINPVTSRGPSSCFGISSADTGVDLAANGSGDNQADSGEEQKFEYSWPSGTPTMCTQISVYKFYNASAPVDVVVNGVDMRPSSDCPAGSVCTVVQSRGYNTSCAIKNIGTGRIVERELTIVY